MTFPRLRDQHACDRIERVLGRRILAQRHQEDRILLSDALAHSLLQRRLLPCHHVVVTDDVVDFHFVANGE